MKRNNLTFWLILGVLVVGLVFYFGMNPGSTEGMPSGDGPIYQVTVSSNWGSGADPNMMAPPRTGQGVGDGPHSGNFFFVTHGPGYNLFTPGRPARPGIGRTSMFGTVDTLKKNVTDYYDVEVHPPIALPGTAQAMIKANDAHPLFSFSAMVAPSPDWFYGVPNVSLKRNGRWVNNISMNVMAYDAGTDSGRKFQNMPDYPTRPPQSVSVLGQPLWRGRPGTFARLTLTRVR